MESGSGEPNPRSSKKASTSRGQGEPDEGSNGMPEPLQPESERRQIRHKYRVFIDDMKEHQQDLIDPESDSLNERLKEADELFKPVKMTREAALDSTAMAIIANYGRQKAQALHTEFVKFQPIEFAEKLMSFMAGQEIGDEDPGARMTKDVWEKLGDAVQPFFKKSPAFHCLYGTFDRGEMDLSRPTRQLLNRQPDNNKEKHTRPEQLPSFEGERQEATTAEVERVLGILQRQHQKAGQVPICYFEFIMNPDSFGQTVENIFYASFLVRDGLARVFLDDDLLPVIVPVTGDDNKRRKKESQRSQVIITMSKAEWKQIIETFQINEPMIPSRPNKARASNGVDKATKENGT